MMDAVRSFLNSTGLIGDGPALAERLHRDGYLFLRGLLPRAAVLEVRLRLLENAAAGGWLDPERPLEDGIANPAAACKDPEERYMQVFRGLWADEALHRLRTHPHVLALFDGIFGEPALAHPMFVQRNIFPQSESFDFTTGEHQDKVHIGGATSHAMWVPLGDCPREKGALAVAAGSHRAGVLDTKVGGGAGGMDICVPIPGEWVSGSFEAGDVLIFSDTTVHRALPNRSTELRQSFDARYQPASQPVAEPNMLPYSGCGTWEEVYAGWSSDDQKYYWKALSPNVVPFDRSYYERRDRMAFAMAESGDATARDTLLRIAQRDPDAEKRERAEELLRHLAGQREGAESLSASA
ncbi:MAG: phytanoyl-CoA dioxygenase family protein [Rhodospirillales bacterium]|nr:phytanoyl-CoA dioxygenase family protein [Rhodospirillales bacterium]MDE0377997.1 phytanoyl-CoA dioxygenase family protein [Rhodospirillales bacterium]